MTGTQRDKSLHDKGFGFKWPFPKKTSFMYKCKSYLTMGFVRSMSRILFFGGANKIRDHNRAIFLKLLGDRSRPLITVSNHRSNIDDPLMWALLSWKEFVQHVDRNRYTLAAHNICFTKQFHTTSECGIKKSPYFENRVLKNPFQHSRSMYGVKHSFFRLFSLGRCVPCVRGAGVYQDGMDFSVEKLNENAWVHIFPEGRVTDKPLRIKWGVGRLIMDCVQAPIVLPVWCTNMSAVWPVHPPYYPRFGHTVDVYFGNPIDTTELREKFATGNEVERRKAITDVIEKEMFLLGEKVGELSPGTVDKLISTEWNDSRR